MTTTTTTGTTARARREPTQQRSRRTVHQILDAAEQIVGTQGVDAATTRAIAERAGVAIPSLYRFFADRDEILDALVEHMTADLDQQAREAEAAWQPGDPADLIRLELDTATAYFEAHPSAVALWFGGRVSPPVVQTIRTRNHALAVRVRDLLISHHLVPEQVPLAVFDLLVELGDRILEVAFRSPGPPNPETIELGTIALTAFAERWAPA
jgi:AcrR family transcriptional regulator